MPNPRRSILDQITHATHALALDPLAQVESLPAFVVVPDELAENFHNAFLSVEQLRDKDRLMPSQMKALAAIEADLASMTKRSDARLWTLEALGSSTEWREVRAKANAALRALGGPPVSPTDPGITYVKGRA